MKRKSLKETNHAGEIGTPAMKYHAVNINRAEKMDLRVQKSDESPNDEVNLKIPSIRLTSDERFLKTKKKLLKVGTWNVRTLYQAGKLDNVIKEMDHMKIDILGLCETRWTENGKINKNDHSMIYSGGEQHINGVGIIMTKAVSKALMGYWPISDRILLIKLQAKPFNIVILQLYAPTTNYSDEDMEQWYERVEETMEVIKSDEYLIIMGDFNAKVGRNRQDNISGQYGLGKRNERGDRLINFCTEHNLMITNTWFKHSSRKLYTWKSPGDVRRNQIDYIIIRNRFRNSVKQVKTYPGADIDSDHNPVVCKIQIKLKSLKVKQGSEAKDFNVLKDERVKMQFAVSVKNKYEKLLVEQLDQEPEYEMEESEKLWEVLKGSLHHARDEVIPKKEKNNNKSWMTCDILNLMGKRKSCKKNKSIKDYKEINNKIKRECMIAKDNWYNKECEEIESLEQTNQSRELHKRIKELTGCRKNNHRTGCIKSRDGNILFDQEEIQKRWVEYIGELYDDNRGQQHQEYARLGEGPELLQEEVKQAIRQMKNGKAAGIDEITTEMLKALDNYGIGKLTELCNVIYKSGNIPQELMNSIFIALPKKPRAMDCSQYRTISLTSHVMKVLLKIILNRNRNKIETEINEVQSGFRQKVGTREGVFNLRIILEKYLEYNRDVFICFIDFEKAFDRVKHEKMIECLNNIRIDGEDLRIISNINWKQRAVVKTEKGFTDEIEIKRGVRQGCVMSPSQFNLYTENIFRENHDITGIGIGGKNINNLRFADDTVLIADKVENLQKHLDIINQIGHTHFNTKINISKTKIMVVSKQDKTAEKIKINLDKHQLEQVDKFIYLGQTITNDGRCEEEIKKRIAIAKNRFCKMKNVLTNKKVRYVTRKRLVQCYIYSTLLYGAESWTISKHSEDRIRSFEMWVHRRMFKISWKERITNLAVLKLVGSNKSIINIIKERKIKYCGHILRHDSLQKELLEGKVNGKRGRGRPRKRWFDNIKEWTGKSFVECKRLAQKRGDWRKMIADLLKADGTD